MKNVKRLLAVGIIAGVATLGTAGIASAQTTSPTGGYPAASSTKSCEKAQDRLAKLDARKVHSEQVIDKVQQAIAKAKAANKDDLVQRLQARLDKVQQRHDHIVDLINKIHARCG